MKKLSLLAILFSLSLVACKKDRLCSCKTVIKSTGSPDLVIDNKVTLVNSSYRTAFNACVHTTQSQTTGTITTSTDVNCSLE